MIKGIIFITVGTIWVCGIAWEAYWKQNVGIAMIMLAMVPIWWILSEIHIMTMQLISK